MKKKANTGICEAFNFAILSKMADSDIDDSWASSDDGSDERSSKPQKSTRFQTVTFLVSISMNFCLIWRFPYIIEKHGSVIFLFAYVISVFLIGLPLCWLDMTLGSTSQLDAVQVWKVSKFSGGVGIALAIISAEVATYIGLITSWSFLYFLFSLQKQPPWLHNSDISKHNAHESYINVSHYNESTGISKIENYNSICEDFFLHNIVNVDMDSLSNFGSFNEIRWSQSLCLLLTWICTCATLTKGIRAAQKLAFIGAVLVTSMLCLSLGTSVLEEDSAKRLTYFLTIPWQNLFHTDLWHDAVTQALISLGPGYGWLISITSSKTYNNNCLNDSIFITILHVIFCTLVAFVNFTFTETENFKRPSITNSYNNDIGFVLVLFSAKLSQLPINFLWNAFFFLGLSLLGLATNTFFNYTIYQWLVSINWKYLQNYKKNITAITIMTFHFICGCLLTTPGGYLIIAILDHYVTSWSALTIVIFECIIIGWLYGGKKFIYNVYEETGYRSWIPWWFLWEFIIPVVLASLLLMKWINGDKTTHAFNERAILYGQITSIIPVTIIPLHAMWTFLSTNICNKKSDSTVSDARVQWSRMSGRKRNSETSISKKPPSHNSEGIVLVCIDDPGYGKIPHGFSFDSEQKNISEVLQELPSLSHRSNSPSIKSDGEVELHDAVKDKPTSKNVSSSNNSISSSKACTILNLQRGKDKEPLQLTGKNSSAIIIAQKMPYPSPLAISNLPSLVVVPLECR